MCHCRSGTLMTIKTLTVASGPLPPASCDTPQLGDTEESRASARHANGFSEREWTGIIRAPFARCSSLSSSSLSFALFLASTFRSYPGPSKKLNFRDMFVCACVMVASIQEKFPTYSHREIQCRMQEPVQQGSTRRHLHQRTAPASDLRESER